MILLFNQTSAQTFSDRKLVQLVRLSNATPDRLTALWPPQKPDIEFRWAGTFDTIRNGLPLIGQVSGVKGVYAAYGYGGNGITTVFSRRS